jgi:DNA invertase Pin-like site-specific DNA recombinase
MAAVAELEAGLISSRTKAALAAAKARGKVLGGNRGAVLSAEARATGRAVQIKRAGERAADLRPMIRDLQQGGADTLCAIARALSERGVPTARGGYCWTATQVARVLERQQ